LIGITRDLRWPVAAPRALVRSLTIDAHGGCDDESLDASSRATDYVEDHGGSGAVRMDVPMRSVHGLAYSHGGSEVNHDFGVFQGRGDIERIDDVPLHESHRPLGDVRQQESRLVNVRSMDLRVEIVKDGDLVPARDEEVRQVRTNEAGAPRDQDLHAPASISASAYATRMLSSTKRAARLDHVEAESVKATVLPEGGLGVG
jgi:hypothetical protein